MPNIINNTSTWTREPETWNNPQITQNITNRSFNIGQHFNCSNYFNNVRAKPWRFLFRDYWNGFEQVNVGWKLATKSLKPLHSSQLRTFCTSIVETKCQKVTNWHIQLGFTCSKATTSKCKLAFIEKTLVRSAILWSACN